MVLLAVLEFQASIDQLVVDPDIFLGIPGDPESEECESRVFIQYRLHRFNRIVGLDYSTDRRSFLKPGRVVILL